MLMLTNPTLIIKRNGTLLKTKSVMMNPIMRMSGHVQMGTYGADNEPPDIEDEVGDNEEHIKTITMPTVGKIIGVPIKNPVMYMGENTMGDMREPYMMAVMCPTVGPKNILRYAGTFAGDDVQVQDWRGGYSSHW